MNVHTGVFVGVCSRRRKEGRFCTHKRLCGEGIGVCTCERSCPWKREAEVCACMIVRAQRKEGRMCAHVGKRWSVCVCPCACVLVEEKSQLGLCSEHICACAVCARTVLRALCTGAPPVPAGTAIFMPTPGPSPSPCLGVGVLRRRSRQPLVSSSLGRPGGPQVLETCPPWRPPPAGPGPQGARDPAEGRLEPRVQGCITVGSEGRRAEASVRCRGRRVLSHPGPASHPLPDAPDAPEAASPVHTYSALVSSQDSRNLHLLCADWHTMGTRETWRVERVGAGQSPTQSCLQSGLTSLLVQVIQLKAPQRAPGGSEPTPSMLSL